METRQRSLLRCGIGIRGVGKRPARCKEYEPDEILLATACIRSIRARRRALRSRNGNAKRSKPVFGQEHGSICCYPTEPGLIAAQVKLIHEIALRKARELRNSAHCFFRPMAYRKRSLKPAIPMRGRWTVRRRPIVAGTGNSRILIGSVCYQSKVGPLEWIGPSTEDEVRRAGTDMAFPGCCCSDRIRIGAFGNTGRVGYRIPTSRQGK